MDGPQLSAMARAVLVRAAELHRDDPDVAAWLHDQIRRLDGPLRIAVAGKVKAGKSTLHAFLQAMLYGLERRPGVGSAAKLHKKYRQWDAPERLGGTLRLAHEGHALLKRFHTVNRSKFLHIVHPPDCSGWLMRLCYFLDDVHYTRFAAICQTLNKFHFNKLLVFVL